MTLPDLTLICEVMLMAEGFQGSRDLARKFVGLHRLAEGTLSKARHYDWKLRAIKTTLAVAGAARRAAPPGAKEEAVLLRALRDFNAGKLTAHDAPLFAGLLDDLFPGLSVAVPRSVDARFEAAVRRREREGGRWRARAAASRPTSSLLPLLFRPPPPPPAWAINPTPDFCSRWPNCGSCSRCGGQSFCSGRRARARPRYGARWRRSKRR
jgi:hypothetical protein